MDLTRAKMLGSIRHDQNLARQASEWVEHAVRSDRLKNNGSSAPGGHHPASGGYRRQSEWRSCRTRSGNSTGRIPLPGALMAQERGASHEEHRERREAGIGHGILAVT